jgi:hypothetical protein
VGKSYLDPIHKNSNIQKSFYLPQSSQRKYSQLLERMGSRPADVKRASSEQKLKKFVSRQNRSLDVAENFEQCVKNSSFLRSQCLLEDGKNQNGCNPMVGNKDL